MRGGPLVAPSGKSLSVFDSAMHKTSNLISNYILSPSKLGQGGGLGTGVEVLSTDEIPSLTLRIDKILSNFDKLAA